MRLNVRAFAIACGLMWGAGIFLGTWWVILSFVGLVWALADGIIGGAIFAWLYNALSGSRVAQS